MSGMVTSVDFDRLSYMAQRPHYRGVHSEHITALAQYIQRLKVIPSDRAPRTLVTMNSRFRVRDLESDETEVYTLVYPEQVNVEMGRVSALSPLGRAALGRRVGDEIEIEAPMGVRKAKIEKLLFQPEAAGHFEL